ncbi:MAG: hypothetical protein J7L11_02160 [Thermoprotei archaeon]|nr:hypothetical protein [Thermoprotei archaeon]
MSRSKTLGYSGGSGPQVFLEILFYDAEFMNTALRLGKEYEVRDILTESDRYRDPQALILTPEIAWSIGNEIVMHRQNEYLRVIKAGKGLTANEGCREGRTSGYR